MNAGSEPPEIDNLALVAEIASCVERRTVSKAVVELARDARLLLPIDEDPDGGPPALTVIEHDGQRLVAAFTSIETLQEAAPDAEQVAVATGAEIAALLPEATGLAIDIATVGIALDPYDIIHAAESQAADSGGRIFLGEPAEPPVDLLTRLRAALPDNPGVRSAHLLQSVTEPTADDETPEVALLLGIVTERGTSNDSVYDEVGPAIGDLTVPLDLVLLPADGGSGRDEPARSLRATPPFYVRA